MSQTPAQPMTLDASQVDAAAQLLGRAFQRDPLMLYFVPNAIRREHLLPSFFRVVLRYCSHYGRVYTTPELAGVACCLPPGQTNPTISRLIGIGLRGRPGWPGLAALLRLARALILADQVHAQIAPGAHWYLWVLGVEPHNQGQGAGSGLLKTVLQQASSQNLPCYLETENIHNVPFYQHHGFRLVSESTVKGSELHIYAMFWEPEKV